MKKQLIIIGTIAILVCVGLSGCTTNEEKVLGRWKTTIPHSNITAIFNFFTNGSYYEDLYENNNETYIWGTYTIKDETIVLQIGGVNHTVYYSFSNNDNILILLETSDGAVYLVLTKQ
jgi:hypothetical protein